MFIVNKKTTLKLKYYILKYTLTYTKESSFVLLLLNSKTNFLYEIFPLDNFEGLKRVFKIDLKDINEKEIENERLPEKDIETKVFNLETKTYEIIKIS